MIRIWFLRTDINIHWYSLFKNPLKENTCDQIHHVDGTHTGDYLKSTYPIFLVDTIKNKVQSYERWYF